MSCENGNDDGSHDHAGIFAQIIFAVLRHVTRVFGRPTGGLYPDYAVAEFAADARRRVRRRTLVLQAPDNKADSVKSATPCGFKCRENIRKVASSFGCQVPNALSPLGVWSALFGSKWKALRRDCSKPLSWLRFGAVRKKAYGSGRFDGFFKTPGCAVGVIVGVIMLCNRSGYLWSDITPPITGLVGHSPDAATLQTMSLYRVLQM
jgi:hypothetical protein